jgi:hypothetical protein
VVSTDAGSTDDKVRSEAVPPDGSRTPPATQRRIREEANWGRSVFDPDLPASATLARRGRIVDPAGGLMGHRESFKVAATPARKETIVRGG